MESYTILAVIVGLAYLMQLVKAITGTTIQFTGSPKSSEVIEHSSVNFHCGLDLQVDPGDTATYTLKWMRDNNDDDSDLMITYQYVRNTFTEVSRSTTLSRDNYIFEVAGKSLKHFDFGISSVSRQDGMYKYYCAVFRDFRMMGKSDRASLIVKAVPRSEFPKCTQNSDPLQFRCISENITPPVNLELLKNDTHLTNKTVVVNEDRIEILYTIDINKYTDGEIYICKQRTSVDTNVRQCTVGPFNFMPSVSISYYTNTGTTQVKQGNTVHFICDADTTYPLSFRWEFDPPVDNIHQRGDVVSVTIPYINTFSVKCTVHSKVWSKPIEETLVISVQKEFILTTSSNPLYVHQPTTDSNLNRQSISIALIVTTVGAIILFVIIIYGALFYYTRLYPCHMHRVVRQPEIYYEPCDSISKEMQHNQWQRSVGVQTVNDQSAEPNYSEVSGASSERKERDSIRIYEIDDHIKP